MKIIRMYSGPDGQSHLEDIEMPLSERKGASSRLLQEQGVKVQQTELMKATGMLYRETIGAYTSPWHNAPYRQFIIPLEGVQEVEIGDGTKRIIFPGDILLCEDTTGQGHKTRDLKSPRKVVVVTID